MDAVALDHVLAFDLSLHINIKVNKVIPRFLAWNKLFTLCAFFKRLPSV